MSEAAWSPVGARMPEPDQLRLLAQVARMYHERGLKQPEIAVELHLSQARVSRLLKQAVDLGIVRTVVTLPPGVYTDLEDEVRDRYALRDVVVVDAGGAGGDVIRALGAGAAQYLDATLTGGEVIGISSWSETLLSAVESLRSQNGQPAEQVVQLVGGVGNPQVQVQATRLASRLAEMTGAEPVFLPAPGLVSSPAVCRALMDDTSVAAVADAWLRVTMALVGIGSLEPSPLLQRSGNAVADADREALRRLGAVGDVCYRFFDERGELVDSGLDGRVVGIPPRDFRRIPRRLGIAGGERKFSAIRAALLGGWVNVLITDLTMARRLLQAPESVDARESASTAGG
jgi:DNA-binding transcriptional regulator LsrR (DeoR family)